MKFRLLAVALSLLGMNVSAGVKVFRATSSGSAGVTVGNAVTSGAANAVLYEDGSQNVAASSSFTFNGTTVTLPMMSVTTPTVTGPLYGRNSAGGCTVARLTLSSLSQNTSGITLENNAGGVDFCSSGTMGVEFITQAGVPQFAVGAGGTPGTAANPLLPIAPGVFNTGIVGASASDFRVTISGTENMRLTATGLKIGAAANPAQALDVAGNALVSGLTTATGGLLIQVSTGPRTNVTPTAAGQLVYDSTDALICFSTGTAQNSWVEVGSLVGAACPH